MKSVLLALLLAGACKKDPPPPPAVYWKDSVCACTDSSCVWKLSLYKPHLGTPAADGAANAALIKAGERCIAELDRADTERRAAENNRNMPAPPAQLPTDRSADAVLAMIRSWRAEPALGLDSFEARYVDSSGVLDAEFGELHYTFGAVTVPADDPKRKTGAPVPAVEVVTQCPVILLSKTWGTGLGMCRNVAAYLPRCTVAEIWRRAIAAGAMADALATIRLTNLAPVTWRFTIRDAPRNIDFAHTFPDDCERQLEQP